jgi:hypothetical protein
MPNGSRRPTPPHPDACVNARLDRCAVHCLRTHSATDCAFHTVSFGLLAYPIGRSRCRVNGFNTAYTERCSAADALCGMIRFVDAGCTAASRSAATRRPPSCLHHSQASSAQCAVRRSLCTHSSVVSKPSVVPPVGVLCRESVARCARPPAFH